MEILLLLRFLSEKEEGHLLSENSQGYITDLRKVKSQESEWTKEMYLEVLRAYLRLISQAFVFNRPVRNLIAELEDDSVPVTVKMMVNWM